LCEITAADETTPCEGEQHHESSSDAYVCSSRADPTLTARSRS
jgi:hypothetical protein